MSDHKELKEEVNIEPIDVDQCQAERREGSFMTLGPRTIVRCKNMPTHIAVENSPGKDGLKGAMSLCERCTKVMKSQCGEDYATLYRIKGKREGR